MESPVKEELLIITRVICDHMLLSTDTMDDVVG